MKTPAVLANPFTGLATSTPVLPVDSNQRKGVPIFSGVLNYFPLAIAAVARHSKRGNDKYNPGQPLHHDRSKSQDHRDCVARHLIDVNTYNTELDEYEDAAAMAWRSLAILQELEEKRLNAPMARGATSDEFPGDARKPARE